jgi:hypothetical protein
MSTNKVTENTPVQDHYRSDALIATGATLSVLILGGVLQFISPKVTPEKTASETAVSQPTTTYSTSLSTGSEDAKSLEMNPSKLVQPTSEKTEEIALATENLSATSTQMTETATTAPATTAPATTAPATTAPATTAPATTAPATTAPATTAPATTAPATKMAIPESTITDPATLQTLNSQIFNKINDSWTTNPTFTSSLVYQINVTESGAIASYEEINESAKIYTNETPLPSLIDQAATSDKIAKFVVVFTPIGQLEVSPWISGN